MFFIYFNLFQGNCLDHILFNKCKEMKIFFENTIKAFLKTDSNVHKEINLITYEVQINEFKCTFLEYT